MGLITEEVEIQLNNLNIKHFENLCYEIPKYKNSKKNMCVKKGTKIIVKVKDLFNSSNVYVEVKCDSCGKEFKVRWVEYNKYVKENGKYYCQLCANNNYQKWISFEQWCLDNNRQDVLDRWDYELNNRRPSEITYATDKKYYFKCPRGLHKSEWNSIANFTNGSNGTMECNQCNSFAQYLIDNYGENALVKYWDYEKNILDPWKIDKASSTKKIWIKCQEKDYHGSYDMKPNTFYSQNSRCPYCSNRNGKVHPLDSLGALYPEVLEVWSDKNKKTPYEYAPYSNQDIYWKCPKGIHKDYSRKISESNLRNFRCPECDYSKGEEKISNYFVNLGFVKINDEDYKLLDKILKYKHTYFIPQKKFNDLIGLKGGLLSYDFYLPNLKYNLLIEFDGIFHYELIKFRKNEPIKYAEERLKKQQEHDRLKDEYAKNNNINLLRIPYWEFDNIEKILNNYLNINMEELEIC